MLFNNLDNNMDEQLRLTEDAAESMPPLKEPNNQDRGFVRRLFVVAAIVVGVALVYCGAYMVRYEVIVIPKADARSMTVVQYLVRDRWTGDIEVIWQAPNGQVFQSKYHPFDGSHDAPMKPTASIRNFIPLDQATEVAR